MKSSDKFSVRVKIGNQFFKKNVSKLEEEENILFNRYYETVGTSSNDIGSQKAIVKNVELKEADLKSKKRICIARAFITLSIIGAMVFTGAKVVDTINNSNREIKDPYLNVQLDGLKAPSVETYVNNQNQTFLTMDSSLEISRYNYLTVIKELDEYNKLVGKEDRYNINFNEFSCLTSSGVRIRESSFRLYNEDDVKYKGPFKFGGDAVVEANEVAVRLTGKPIIESVEDLEDPVISDKAFHYLLIKNYEYLYDYVEKNNYNFDITPQMTIDTHLMGCGNMFKNLDKMAKTGDEYKQYYYSKDVDSIVDILKSYSNKLFYEHMQEDEHNALRSEVYSMLHSFKSAKDKGLEK